MTVLAQIEDILSNILSKWVACVKVPYDVRQTKIRSACAFTPCDESFRCPLYDALYTECKAKTCQTQQILGLILIFVWCNIIR